MLSGGERNRYALARILVSPSNFLLLDEPTNHLDMRAKDVLLEALAGYTGTVVFVSHDRYFIDRLATRVLEIENGAITAFEGNYEDYSRRKVALTASPPKNGHPSEDRPPRRTIESKDLHLNLNPKIPLPKRPRRPAPPSSSRVVSRVPTVHHHHRRLVRAA